MVLLGLPVLVIYDPKPDLLYLLFLGDGILRARGTLQSRSFRLDRRFRCLLMRAAFFRKCLCSTLLLIVVTETFTDRAQTRPIRSSPCSHPHMMGFGMSFALVSNAVRISYATWWMPWNLGFSAKTASSSSKHAEPDAGSPTKRTSTSNRDFGRMPS